MIEESPMSRNDFAAPTKSSAKGSALERLIRALAVAIACASVFVVLN
jgi:hypothetical protein